MRRKHLLIFPILLLLLSGCMQSGEAGQVGVVRNGGPFDNHNIRQIIPQGAGNTWNGFFSTTHFYPAGNVQRYYTITANKGEGDQPGVDVVYVPTADGIQVGLEGTFYFNTAFDGSAQGTKLLQDFDTQFGTRTFPLQGSPGDFTHAYDGDTGWESFLSAVVRPVIDNELRQAIASTKCSDLIASCALVSSQGIKNVQTTIQNSDTNSTIQSVEERVNSGLQTDINSTLGEPYFANIKFNLQRVTLPTQVQGAINEAQAAFAQVAKAQAQVAQAQQQNAANAAVAKLYKKYPALAQIQMIKSLPAGTNVYFGVQPTVIAGGAGK